MERKDLRTDKDVSVIKEEKSKISDATSIPKKIHTIWFGGSLPEKYKANITLLKLMNPFYSHTLWTDKTTMSPEEAKKLELFCTSLGIQLIDIDKDKDFPNINHIKYELESKHWARASDIARVSILYTVGGAYLDTDLAPRKGLGELTAPLGILEYITYDNPNIDFMASTNKHPFYKACVRHFDEIYNLIRKDDSHKLWFSTKDSFLSIDVTKLASGYIVADMLRKLYKNTPEHWDSVKDKINFDVNQCVIHQNDNTWLKKGVTDTTGMIEFYSFMAKREAFLKSPECNSYVSSIQSELEEYEKLLKDIHPTPSSIAAEIKVGDPSLTTFGSSQGVEICTALNNIFGATWKYNSKHNIAFFLDTHEETSQSCYQFLKDAGVNVVKQPTPNKLPIQYIVGIPSPDLEQLKKIRPFSIETSKPGFD